MTPVVLVSTGGTEQVTVNVEGINPAQYQQVSDFLGVALQQQKTQAYIGGYSGFFVANTVEKRVGI